MESSREPTQREGRGDRRTAFISWAHGTASWERVVLDFATALRTVGGIDVDLDLWHSTDHENWTTYGPTGIRDNEFILLAVDAAYRQRWEGTNRSGEGAGAAREAAAIKAIFERDQSVFRRRVIVVLLPGAAATDIPDELLGMSERFVVKTFDLAGLEPLLRSLYGKPLDEKPPLGPLPALPPRYIAEIANASDALSQASTDVSATSPAVGASEGGSDADALERRLAELEEALKSFRPEDIDGNQALPWNRAWGHLIQEREAVKASLDALERSENRAVLRTDDSLLETPDDQVTTDNTLGTASVAGPALLDSVATYDAVLALLRAGDRIGLSEILRDERREFERPIEALVEGRREEQPTATSAAECHAELLPVLERRLAGLLPLADYDANAFAEEVQELADWSDRQPNRGGYLFWPMLRRWAIWWLGYALGAVAVNRRKWDVLTPLFAARTQSIYGTAEPLIQSVPGEAGGTIGEAIMTTQRWIAPYWELLKADMSSSAVLSARFPELVEREGEPEASLAAFDFLMSIALGLANHRAAAHWTMGTGGADRLARRLHGDPVQRAAVATALGVSLDAFDERAPAALDAVHPLGVFPELAAKSILKGQTAA